MALRWLTVVVLYLLRHSSVEAQTGSLMVARCRTRGNWEPRPCAAESQHWRADCCRRDNCVITACYRSCAAVRVGLRCELRRTNASHAWPLHNTRQRCVWGVLPNAVDCHGTRCCIFVCTLSPGRVGGAVTAVTAS